MSELLRESTCVCVREPVIAHMNHVVFALGLSIPRRCNAHSRNSFGAEPYLRLVVFAEIRFIRLKSQSRKGRRDDYKR